MIAIAALIATPVSAADVPLQYGIYGNPKTGHFAVVSERKRRNGSCDVLLVDGRGAVLRKYEARKGEDLIGLDEFDAPVLRTEEDRFRLLPKGREKGWRMNTEIVIGDVEFSANREVVSYRGRMNGYFEGSAFNGFAPLPDRPAIVFTSIGPGAAISVATGAGRASVRSVPLLFEGRPVRLDASDISTVGLSGERAALFVNGGDLPEAALAPLPVTRTVPPNLNMGERVGRDCLAVVSLTTGRVGPIALFEINWKPGSLSAPRTSGAFAVSGNAIFTVRDNKLVRTELPPAE